MDDTMRQTQVKWLYCFACGEPFELVGLGATCNCRRSAAVMDGGVLEIRGPARALAPVEDVVRVDGGEWVPVFEGVTIKRRVARAA
jgi:hypothetical protein